MGNGSATVYVKFWNNVTPVHQITLFEFYWWAKINGGYEFSKYENGPHFPTGSAREVIASTDIKDDSIVVNTLNIISSNIYNSLL